jgi:hypothetical protein
MVDEKTVQHLVANFEVDRDRADPKAKHRRTHKAVRYDLIRRCFHIYMTHPLVPEFRRNTTEAVRQIMEGWKGKPFGVRLTERTIYRALNLRRRAKK